MKIAKTYKLSQLSIDRIEELKAMLPAENSTHVVEEAIASAHREEKLANYIGRLQAELAQLWAKFELHPHYSIYKDKDDLHMYNHAYRSRKASRGIFASVVISKSGSSYYETSYTMSQLNDLVQSEKFFVP